MLKTDDEVSDSGIIASAPIKHNAFSTFSSTPATAQPLLDGNRTTQQCSHAGQSTFRAAKSASWRKKRCIRATRQVLWPAWQHCWVVRLTSRKGFVGVCDQKNVQKALCSIRFEAIMADSETSSSILNIWLTPEQQFEKVVLWR